MVPFKPFVAIRDFSDIGPIAKHGVDFASCEGRIRRSIGKAFVLEPLHQVIQRYVLIRKQMKDSFDCLCCDIINLNNASAVDANVFVAVRSFPDEPTLMDATL